MIIKSKDENEGTTIYTPICIKSSKKIDKKVSRTFLSPRGGSTSNDLVQHEVINKRSLSPREEIKNEEKVPKHLQ